MSRRNQKRAAILNRLNQVCNVRGIMKEGNYSARQLADAVLLIQSKFAEALFGGEPHYTGNNRVFANGTVAYEVLCKTCRRAFWTTKMPFAVCPDCEH